MTDSQKVAAVVALNHLGYDVRARSGGVTVLLVQQGSPAAKVLQPDDVIVSVNGKKVASVLALRNALAAKRPGTTVRIGYRRDGKVRTAAIETVADPRTRSGRSSASRPLTTSRSSCRSGSGSMPVASVARRPDSPSR